jgi:predicted ATP-grasp superfamily ATP-dependent carboligase
MVLHSLTKLEWMHKILFTYQPERPIIDTFTKLEFNVINITDDENLNSDARVVVINGQRLFQIRKYNCT